MLRKSSLFFFFQAEDGIRDVAVTGVQTCALPISIVTAQRCEFGVKQPYRAEIDVQVELEAQAEQNIPGMLVPGDSRVADRPEEDRVYVVAQVAERRLRERLARREVVIGAVGKALEVEPEAVLCGGLLDRPERRDRKSTRLNSSHGYISYAVFCLKKKKN